MKCQILGNVLTCFVARGLRALTQHIYKIYMLKEAFGACINSKGSDQPVYLYSLVRSLCCYGLSEEQKEFKILVCTVSLPSNTQNFKLESELFRYQQFLTKLFVKMSVCFLSVWYQIWVEFEQQTLQTLIRLFRSCTHYLKLQILFEA